MILRHIALYNIDYIIVHYVMLYHITSYVYICTYIYIYICYISIIIIIIMFVIIINIIVYIYIYVYTYVLYQELTTLLGFALARLPGVPARLKEIYVVYTSNVVYINRLCKYKEIYVVYISLMY